MPTRDPFYTTPAWKRLRLYILGRDGHQCQIGLPVCTGHATHVDHIKPRSAYPDLSMDPNNLRAACKECNQFLGGKIGGLKSKHASKRTRRALADGFASW
jgi:5-methylcytosine-specific restriction endonuclease McrA